MLIFNRIRSIIGLKVREGQDNLLLFDCEEVEIDIWNIRIIIRY